jgi:tetratricopeptide (TPR) repeat protein
MKQLALILLFIFAVNLSFADVQSKVEDAADAYNQDTDEGYIQARDLYHEIIDYGYISSELFYNLGNTYHKLGDDPNAILYFEKAKLLDPEDEAVNENLEIISVENSEFIDKSFSIKKWYNELLQQNSVETYGMIAIEAFIAALLLFALFVFSGRIMIKRIGFWLGVVFVVISIGFYFLGTERVDQIENNDQVILMEGGDNVSLLVSPEGKEKTNEEELIAGTKFTVIDEVGEWCELENNQFSGWIHKDYIKRIRIDNYN